MNAKHWADTVQGRVFSQTTTPLGLAIPIYTATAIGAVGVCALPLWNPPASGVYVELLRTELGFGNPNATAAVFGAIGLMAGPLNNIVSGAAMSALTPTTPVNCNLLASSGGSKCVSSNGATTGTVVAGVATAPIMGTNAAGWVRTMWDINLEAATTTAHPTGIHTYDFDGTILIPPGVFVYLAGTLASVALYSASIVWKEVPITR